MYSRDTTVTVWSQSEASPCITSVMTTASLISIPSEVLKAKGCGIYTGDYLG